MFGLVDVDDCRHDAGDVAVRGHRRQRRDGKQSIPIEDAAPTDTARSRVPSTCVELALPGETK